MARTRLHRAAVENQTATTQVKTAQVKLLRAALEAKRADERLTAARAKLKAEAVRLRGLVAIRETARSTGLSSTTVGHFFAGRLSVSAAKAVTIAKALVPKLAKGWKRNA